MGRERERYICVCVRAEQLSQRTRRSMIYGTSQPTPPAATQMWRHPATINAAAPPASSFKKESRRLRLYKARSRIVEKVVFLEANQTFPAVGTHMNHGTPPTLFFVRAPPPLPLLLAEERKSRTPHLSRVGGWAVGSVVCCITLQASFSGSMFGIKYGSGGGGGIKG